MVTRTLLTLLAAIAVISVGCTDDDDPTTTPAPSATSTADPTVATGGGGASTAAGPGISVSEALDSTLDGPLLIDGFLVVTDGEARLCEALAESFPPQCGGESLLVEADDPTTLADLETEGAVSWTAQSIQLLGEVEDGTLRVSDGSTA